VSEQVSQSSPISGHVYLSRGKRRSTWYYHARLPREVRKRLGPAWSGKGRPPAEYFTRKTAETALAAILTDARRGVGDNRHRTAATFKDACDEWLRYIENDRKRRISTLTDYRRLVDGDLGREFGALPLDQVTADRIERYRSRLVNEGKLSARSINKRLVAMHGILRRAQRVYGLRDNPAQLVDRQPLKRSGDFRVISPSEVEALARAVESDQDAALFRVAAYTGLRLGELRALRWCDVDFGLRLVHVRRSFTYGAVNTPKSGRVRSVPLIDQAARALDGLSRRELFIGDDDLVFPGTAGGYFDDSAARRRFKAALTAAKLKPMRFHDLRHTFGTTAVQAFPLSDVKAYMGHADISTTMIYVHHVPQVGAAEKLSALVGAAFEAAVSAPDLLPDSPDSIAMPRAQRTQSEVLSPFPLTRTSSSDSKSGDSGTSRV
jgi:integrase